MYKTLRVPHKMKTFGTNKQVQKSDNKRELAQENQPCFYTLALNNLRRRLKEFY